jgi:hypothetical protein
MLDYYKIRYILDTFYKDKFWVDQRFTDGISMKKFIQ